MDASTANEPNTDIVLAAETSRNDHGDDSQKQAKRESIAPESLPTRHSSLPRTRGRAESSKSSKSKPDSPISENHTSAIAAFDDVPPTPPPKNDSPKSVQKSIPSSSPPKKEGFFASLVTRVVSCCIPSKSHDDEVRRQPFRRRRADKESIEMDTTKQDDDHPTTSTISPGVEVESPPVPARDTPEEIKPSVTIAPDVITDKESTPRIITPPLGPLTEDDDEENGFIPSEDREREKEIRQSMQIQAPFPPSADEQTDAVVVSPAPQVSLQHTSDSDESEEEEEPLEVIRAIVDEPQPRGPFLGPVPESKKGRKCLVLDLDECLIHSTFQDSKSYDFSISLDLDKDYGLSYIYVGKRPHLDEFLEEMGRLYEIVIFTASLQRYADPVVDIIDRNRVIDHRLFRDSCTRTWDPIQRVYLPNVKNISFLGRDLKKCIIIDNNPQCYQWHPEHAVPISSWFEDHLDVELLTMIPLLKDLASDEVEDVRDVLCQAFHM